MKLFLAWAAERDLTRASQITRPDPGKLINAGSGATARPTASGLGWSTQRERLGTLKDFFRWLTRQNVILHNPASELELPRPEKRLPQEVLTLAASRKAAGRARHRTIRLGVRDRAMLELFYSTGIRRTELCRLELPDLNAERRTLHVRLGKGKKDRMVPVGERAAALAGTLLAGSAPAAVPGHAHAGLVPHRLRRGVQSRRGVAHGRRWLKQAGLTRKGCCHVLRHTCATHMLENGADIRFIQQLLGHEKLDTTAIYTEVSIKQLQEVHARCHPSAKLAAENPASIPTPNV